MKLPANAKANIQSPDNHFKLSIVIPCHNEKKRINLLWNALSDFTKKWKHDYEIILIDNGSTDGTFDAIEANNFANDQIQKSKLSIHKLSQPQEKGKVLKEGIFAAKGSHILTVDADLNYDFHNAIEWLGLEKGFRDDEILIGNKSIKTSKVTDQKEAQEKSPKRNFAHTLINRIANIFTTIKVNDSFSGFIIYPAAVAKYLFNSMKNDGVIHAVENLYLADLQRIRLREMLLRTPSNSSKINGLAAIKLFFQTLLIGITTRLKYYIGDPFKLLISKNKELIPPHQDDLKYKSESAYRLLFSLLTIFIFLFMPWISKDFAIAGDEWIQNSYGKEVFNFFFHGDPTAYQEVGRPQGYDNIIYYSGGYELMLASIAKLFPHAFEYDVRHFLIAITGALLFLFTGLLGKRLGGWKVGFFSLLFIFCSPRLFGESMNNSKDIPFALGIIFTLYHMIPFVRDIPKPKWRSIILVSLGIALTMNVRIGGLLLFAYLGLFSLIMYIIKFQAKEIENFFGNSFKSLAGIFIFIFLVSYFLGIITWPYALQSPILNPLQSLEEMTNFTMTLRILFDGEIIVSNMIPWHYIPTWIRITSPEIIMVLFVIFVLIIYFIKNHFKNIFIYFLLFATVFPVAYAIYQKSVLYDGWRHFLFIYPGIVVGAGLVVGYILDIAKKKTVRIGVQAIIAIGLFFPVKQMIALHPYQYVYFNDAFGGLPAAFKNYETDYYMTTAKESFYTLAEKEDFYNLTDTVIVMTNMGKEVQEYATTVSPYIKTIYSKFENRIQQEYDYAIFFSRFLDHTLLKTNAWPPSSTYFTISRQDVPLAIILKNETKGDYLGTQAMNANDWENAIAHYNRYLETDPSNEMVLFNMGSIYMSLQQFDQAVAYFEKAMQYYPTDQIVINLGLAQLNLGNTAEAIQVLERGAQKIRVEFDKYRNMVMEDEENNTAMSLLQMNGQVLSTYYHYLSICYQQSGQMEQAQQYSELSRQLNPQRQ